MQYTLRNIPSELDLALRETAREQSKSLNQVAIEALQKAAGLDRPAPTKRRDLSDIAGTWQANPEVDAALEDQRRINHEAWE